MEITESGEMIVRRHLKPMGWWCYVGANILLKYCRYSMNFFVKYSPFILRHVELASARILGPICECETGAVVLQ